MVAETLREYIEYVKKNKLPISQVPGTGSQEGHTVLIVKFGDNSFEFGYDPTTMQRFGEHLEYGPMPEFAKPIEERLEKLNDRLGFLEFRLNVLEGQRLE